MGASGSANTTINNLEFTHMADTSIYKQVPSATDGPSPIARVALFHLGHLVATPGALRALEELGVAPLSLVRRHVVGDWGDLCSEDQLANAAAIESGARIFSSYKLSSIKDGQKVEATIWLITESTDGTIGGPRSHTTLLLPREY